MVCHPQRHVLAFTYDRRLDRPAVRCEEIALAVPDVVAFDVALGRLERGVGVYATSVVIKLEDSQRLIPTFTHVAEISTG